MRMKHENIMPLQRNNTHTTKIKILFFHITKPFIVWVSKRHSPTCVINYVLYDSSVTAPIKTSVKKISNKYSMRAFNKVCPILKCHKVVTVGLVHYKNKTWHGGF